MQRRRLLIVLLASMAVTVSILLGCGKSDQNADDAGNLSQGVFSGRVSAADSVVVHYQAEDSSTVFDLLIEDHQVDYRFYGRNVFILAIDSVYQGNNHVWLFSVNDTMTRAPANLKRVGPGDQVRWFFRDITK